MVPLNFFEYFCNLVPEFEILNKWQRLEVLDGKSISDLYIRNPKKYYKILNEEDDKYSKQNTYFDKIAKDKDESYIEKLEKINTY